MSDVYLVDCPKCNREITEFTFVGCSSYIGFCKEENVLLLYCSMFGEVTVFKNTKERLELPFKNLKFQADKES